MTGPTISAPTPNLYPDSMEVDAGIIADLRVEVGRLRAALSRADEALNQMLIWMPSGFAPQSQGNAMRLANESRKEIASLNHKA